MPWVPGVSGNPGGRPREVLEIREVRRLAQEKTKRAFEIVAGIMENADKDAVRLAAALAVLKLAGVRMDADVTVNVTPQVGGGGGASQAEPIEAVRDRVLAVVRSDA